MRLVSTNLPGLSAQLDVAVKLGLVVVLGIMVLLMCLLAFFLILQQRRLRALEEALNRASLNSRSSDEAAQEVGAGEEESRRDGQRNGRNPWDAEPEDVSSGMDCNGDDPTPERQVVDVERSDEDTEIVPDGERSPGKVTPKGLRPSIQTREGLRERLASAKALLRNLEGEEGALELNRKLAYLQAEVSSMRGSDVLELPAAELQEVLAFQGDLKDFIAERHAAGRSHADPSTFAVEEVKRLEKVIGDIAGCVAENLSVGKVAEAAQAQPKPAGRIQFNGAGGGAPAGKFEIGFSSEVNRLESVIREIEGFVGEQLHIGRELVTGQAAGLTRARLEETLAKADEAFGNLVERQHQLAAGFLNNDLTLVDGQVDVSPDLVGFCRHRNPGSPLLAPQRPALCQFANGEGVYHAEVVTHLDGVRATCREMIARHDEQRKLADEARSLADEGRFAEAEKLLDGVDSAFADLGGDEIKQQIQGWRKKLADLEGHFRRLCELLETPWERPFAQPWKVLRRERLLLAHANEFEQRLERFREELNDSGDKEFVAEGVQLYQRLVEQLNELANTFRSQSADAKISTFLHFALIAESALGWIYAHPESRPVILWTIGILGFAFSLQHFHRWLLGRTTVEFDLETNGKRLEESDKFQVFLNNRRYASGDRIAPGRYQLTLDGSIFEPVTQRVSIRYGRRNRIGSIPVRLSRDTYVNSLEMKLVPVAGTTVMFGVWPVRVRDYRAYANDRKLQWKRPAFKQDDLHPAVNVSWDDACAFCVWLTDRERGMGRIGHRDEYRLPTDLEWSAACGLTGEQGATPEQRSGGVEGEYPWGSKWPPNRESGNFDPALLVDPFDHTSKVGAFKPNRHGLFDLAGNVWEWCEDLHEGKGKNRTLRGGSWHTSSREMLLSSFRLANSPGHRVDIIGFRCVLEVRKPSPLFRPALESA